MGGGGFSMESSPVLDDFVLGLAHRRRPRVCFLATASGDNDNYIRRFYAAFPPGRAAATHCGLFMRDGRDLRRFLLEQDILYVGGGNTANALAVWRLHGVDRILRSAWARGIILCGLSAGMICWFESSVTDSFGPLAPLHDGLEFLKGSACPHYDGEPQRRPTYHKLIRTGALPAGYAADGGAALHFVGTKLKEVVSSRAGAQAYRVEPRRSAAIEMALPARFLG